MKKKMKAAVLNDLKDFKIEMVNIPTIGNNDVLIKVKYCGICGSDVPRAMVSGARKYPIILGHEFAGEIVEIGSSVSNLNLGERVVVAPLIPCKNCQHCKTGDYGLCNNYNIIGTGSDGAFAEYVKVPSDHVLPIDDALDYETAAGIEPATIGYHGIQKANMQAGENIVIMGCGPIGQLTLQWAKIFGAGNIIAVDIFDEKLELAKKLGADITINAKNEDVITKVKDITQNGADIVIETAGSQITQQQSINISKKKGRIVFLGITHKGLDLTESTMEHIMRGELTIKGSWNSYTPPYPGLAWSATLNFMAKGKIQFKPMVSHKIHIEEVETYLKGMVDRTLNYNKVLISFED